MPEIWVCLRLDAAVAGRRKTIGPMTPDEFRLLALRLPGVREQTVLGSVEFRLNERTFATLGWPDAGWATLKIAIADQKKFVAASSAFCVEPGGRGLRGLTRLRLQSLGADTTVAALTAAWRLAKEAKSLRTPLR